jgi:rfaE bifunctional protein nucleotidyltransferase chain/domain
MKKIIHIEEVEELSKKLHAENESVIIAGGCFDILHVGHLTFLEEAKKHGGVLVILLESDETIQASKGPKRPLNLQYDRARMLEALTVVDYVIMLNPKMTNADYDNLVIALKPAIIATTEDDEHRHHKERQAKLVGADVIDVTGFVTDKSTTHVVKLLNEL